MFEKASRMYLRFESPRGLLSVEDLWHLPLQSATGKANLDDIAKGLRDKIKEAGGESFVTPEATVNEEDVLALDIAKHIITVRLEEAREATAAREKAEQKQKILGLIASKKDEALSNMTVEELTKMVNEMK